MSREFSTDIGTGVLRDIDPESRLLADSLGTEFRSPLVVASGTLIERDDQIQPFLDAGAGAVIPRTTRKTMIRTSHPSPHLYQEGTRANVTMLNAEWTGSDISYWRENLGSMAVSQRVIMGVSGRDIEGCVEVCQEMDRHQLPFIEVNIGCGVTNGVLGAITRDEEHVRTLVGSIKAAGVNTPIALKLGHSDSILNLSSVAKEEGADAIVAINTMGPVFDFTIDRKSQPGRVLGVEGGRGGLSGSPLFHQALTDVAMIKREVGLPVIASGGVTTAERAIKFIYAGADLVQVYSYLHERGPEGAPLALTGLTKKMIEYMDSHGIPDLAAIKGKALALMDLPTDLYPKTPVSDHNLCTGCDRCIPACLPNAIDLTPHDNRNGHVVDVNAECVGCGLCLAVCPVEGALKVPRKRTTL